MIIKRD